MTHVGLDAGVTIGAQATTLPVGSRAIALVRPEALAFADPAHRSCGNQLPASIVGCDYLGAALRYQARAGGALLSVRAARLEGARIVPVGAAVTLTWPHRATQLLAE